MRKKRLSLTLFVMTVIAIPTVLRSHAVKSFELKSTLDVLNDGHIRINVENTAGTPITAMVAVGTRTLLSNGSTIRSVRFFDSVLNPYGARAISPGGSFAFSFFGPNPSPNLLKRKVELRAAIFLDGSIWGDPEWIRVLQLRRSAAEHFINEALQAIQGTGAENATKVALIERIEQLRTNEFKSAQTTAERQMADLMFDDVLNSLRETAATDEELTSSSQSLGNVRSRLQLKLNGFSSLKHVLP